MTSAYSSYSGCRQYRENLYDAVAPIGRGAPRLDKLRHYFNHPGFVEPVADGVLAALAELPEEVRDDAHLVFVTHSIPTSMNDAQRPGRRRLRRPAPRACAEVVAERVAEETGRAHPHELVFCSRSGSPHVPWLEPDVNDHLETLAAAGVPGVVLVPIGFVSDHMEVVYDLDTEALATAERLGLTAVRAATPGATTRGSWPWSATCCSSAPPSSAASRSPARASGSLRPAVGPLPGGLLPEPARRAPGAVR